MSLWVYTWFRFFFAFLFVVLWNFFHSLKNTGKHFNKHLSSKNGINVSVNVCFGSLFELSCFEKKIFHSINQNRYDMNECLSFSVWLWSKVTDWATVTQTYLVFLLIFLFVELCDALLEVFYLLLTLAPVFVVSHTKLKGQIHQFSNLLCHQ